MKEIPEWVKPGAEVAAVSFAFASGGPRLAKVTIKNIGKLFVTTTNGDRYSIVRGLTRSTGGTWGYTIQLMDPDDPRVTEIRLAIRERNALNQAKDAAQQFARGRVDVKELLRVLHRTHPAEFIEVSRGD